jgi:hypothetical protein
VSLFDSFEPLDRHLDAGVAYVPVEFDSLIDPRFPNGIQFLTTAICVRWCVGLSISSTVATARSV